MPTAVNVRKEMNNNTDSLDIPDVDLDIPELTESQIQYIRSQQSKATSQVSDPSSPYYEPDESKRFTASRRLMRE